MPHTTTPPTTTPQTTTSQTAASPTTTPRIADLLRQALRRLDDWTLIAFNPRYPHPTRGPETGSADERRTAGRR